MALQSICGGNFTDEEGSPLASGFLDCLLSHDEQNTSGPSQVVAGLRKKIFLDNNGNAVTGSQLFANDAMNPTGSYYEVMAYKNDGTRAWKYPQYVIVTTSLSCFSLSAIIPTNPPAGESNLGEGGLLLQTNGVNNSDQNLLNIQQGSNITITNVAGTTTINAAGGGLPTGQIGDTIRYNVLGDSKWDAVQALPKAIWMGCQTGTGLVTGGFTTSIGNAAGSLTPTACTATDNPAFTYSVVATPSTSTVIGNYMGGAGNNGCFGFQAMYRWTLRFAAGNTANVRYYLGLCYWNDGAGANDNVTPLSNATFATDALERSFVGFRFSAGTDTDWQAVTSNGNVAGHTSTQTTTSTGIAPDTNIHNFEFCWNGVLGEYVFLIDGTVVATISTTLPLATVVGTLGFWSGDNKDTATAISGTFYHMIETLK
jgi:hypothetical protein